MNEIKKSFNKLLLFTVLASVLFIALLFCAIKFCDWQPFSFTEEFSQREFNADSPADGYVMLFGYGASFAADFIQMIFYALFAMVVPIFSAFAAVILQIASSLFMIGEIKKWKLSTAMVLSYISLALQITLLFSGVLNLLINPIVNKLIIAAAIVAGIVLTVFYIRETVIIKKMKSAEYMAVEPQNIPPYQGV